MPSSVRKCSHPEEMRNWKSEWTAKKLVQQVWWLRKPFSKDRSELIKYKLWTDVRKDRKKSGKLSFYHLRRHRKSSRDFREYLLPAETCSLWLLAFSNSFVLYLHFPAWVLFQKVLHRSAKQTIWTNFQFWCAGEVKFGHSRGQMLWKSRYTSGLFVSQILLTHCFIKYSWLLLLLVVLLRSTTWDKLNESRLSQSVNLSENLAPCLPRDRHESPSLWLTRAVR